MKNVYLFFTLLFAVSASAQITFTRSDYASIGDKIYYAVDTPVSSSTNIGLAGANRIWDFTNGVGANKFDSTYFITTVGDASAPTGTNLHVKSLTNDHYETVTSSGMKLNFDQPAYNVTGINLNVLKFPLSYLTTTLDSTILSITGTPAFFGQAPISGVDSLRIDLNIHTATLCDGWGTINIPNGSYNSLRVRTIAVTDANIYAHFTGLVWTYITNQHNKSIDYRWLATNSKGAIASASMDTLGNINNFTYKVLSIPAKPAKIVLVSPNFSEREATLNVTITGSNTHFSQTSATGVSFSQGSSTLQINSINKVNDSTIIASVTIKQTNSLGYYDVKIANPVDGSIFMNASFQVTPSVASLKSVSPASSQKGKTLTITITGNKTHFTQASSVVSFSTSKIHTNSSSVINDTILTCSISIDSTAVSGMYDLNLSNSIDGSISLTAGFSILNVGIHQIQNELASVVMFPNPVNELLNITLKNLQTSTVNLQLYDITGRMIKNIETTKNEFTVDVSELNNGVYFCLITADNFKSSHKIIIHK
jgi:hypothetical protein